jgi:hypothetical protein
MGDNGRAYAQHTNREHEQRVETLNKEFVCLGVAAILSFVLGFTGYFGNVRPLSDCNRRRVSPLYIRRNGPVCYDDREGVYATVDEWQTVNRLIRYAIPLVFSAASHNLFNKNWNQSEDSKSKKRDYRLPVEDCFQKKTSPFFEDRL